MSIDLYDFYFKYSFKKGDKVTWNRKIFRECPYEVEGTKEIGQVAGNFNGIRGIRSWWSWWEIVPTNPIEKPVYWIKFYLWKHLRYNKHLEECLSRRKLNVGR